METMTCEQYVLAELEDAKRENERLLNRIKELENAAAESEAMRSATASACVRSIFPLRNARLVNSPGSAGRQPPSMRHSTMCFCM